jgi:transposase-like protein
LICIDATIMVIALRGTNIHKIGPSGSDYAPFHATHYENRVDNTPIDEAAGPFTVCNHDTLQRPALDRADVVDSHGGGWVSWVAVEAVQGVGTALVAHVAGQGHRRIATELGRPVSTVRRWLRAVRGQHGRWLYRQGVEHTARLAPELLTEIDVAPTELGDALTALAAAVLAAGRRFTRRHRPGASSAPSLTDVSSRRHPIRMINNTAPRHEYVSSMPAP